MESAYERSLRNRIQVGQRLENLGTLLTLPRYLVQHFLGDTNITIIPYIRQRFHMIIPYGGQIEPGLSYSYLNIHACSHEFARSQRFTLIQGSSRNLNQNWAKVFKPSPSGITMLPSG